MKAYIVNLERSPERKAYMQNVLQVLPSLVCDFIPAVDGKAMSEEMRKQQFDVDKFYSRYSIYPRPGEIGCTLSHQKCYRKIVSDNEPYVLILEDDIVLPNNGICEILPELEKRMTSNTPQIILLLNIAVLLLYFKLQRGNGAFCATAENRTADRYQLRHV